MSVERDDLADTLRAVRAEAASQGDVRVELATLNGNVETLTTEVRLSLARVTAAQNEQGEEIREVRDRVSNVEKWQWKVVGASGVIGFAAGSSGVWAFLA